MNTIIDTHAHLDHVDNLKIALSEAHQSGVESVITVGVDLASNKKNLEIRDSTTQPKIHLALGIHPGNIKLEEISETMQLIKLNLTRAVAIGEIGLDYWYRWVKKNPEKKKEQQEVFQKQLELGVDFKLPVIIHSRGAWKECLELTRNARVKKAVFHWYSGPVDVLKEILDSGYFVSATPSLAHSPQAQEAMKYAPIEQTLIETDSPVYYQEGEEGFCSQPKDVFRTLRLYASLKMLDEAESLNTLNNNARQLFGLR
ncbi:MAG: TatD family hydrolase [Candidatus Omnitrophota bacterium]